MREFKTVATIGLGYIGLPTAAILANNGLKVVGVDVNQNTVDAVNRGEVPFVEPDLAEFVEKAVKEGNLSAATTTPKADAYIVAVPTPFNDDKTADLGYIEAAARGIAPQLDGDELIILESTSPPRTTEHMANYLAEQRPDLDISQLLVAHCPERVLPGRIMIELATNDRIVGGLTPEGAEAAKKLYSSFCTGEILLTDAVTAEMAKLVENSYRDVNIAFANELSIISDKLGINVWELIELANHHPRVNILQPGPGVGGHCIAVDPWFIVSALPEESRLIKQARLVNDAKPSWVIEQVEAALAEHQGGKVAVLGLAFKANIDDLRESPSIAIAQQLATDLPDTQFLVVEPHVEETPRALSAFKNVNFTPMQQAVADADVVLLLVDHDKFREIDADALAGKTVIDTRGFWDEKNRH